MRRALFVLLVIAAGAIIVVILTADTDRTAQAQPGRSFVGSEKCATCHADIAGKWKRTLHSKMVRPATRDQIHGDLQAPNAPNLAQLDFAYALGGWYKEERYLP